MSQMTIFDGHNDTLYQLWKHDGDADYFFASQNSHAISDAAARQGGFVAGFAIFSPSDTSLDATSATTADKALSDTLEMLAIADRLAAHKGSRFSDFTVHSAEIAAALTQDRIAALLHIEGAEAIGQNSAALHQLYERGCAQSAHYGHVRIYLVKGCRSSFPATPDTGAGRREAGMNWSQAAISWACC